MMWTSLIAGLLFGAIAQYAKIGDFNTINDMITGKNKTLYKTLLFALGIGMFLFFAFVQLDWAHYSIKPLLIVGVVVGGLLFGVGAAILGYCPGTILIALGNGSIDALFGYIGGLCAGLAFIFLYPYIIDYLGPNFGELQFLTGEPLVDSVIVVVISSTLMTIAWRLK